MQATQMIPLTIPLRYPEEKGLVLYCPFDRIGERKTFDLSPYRNDGTIYGATWRLGKINKALNFDGVDDYVKLKPIENLDVASKFSVELWAYTPDLTAAKALFSKDTYGIILGTTSGGTLWEFYTNDGVVGVACTASTSGHEDKWNHIVITADKDRTPTLIGYINGVQVCTGTHLEWIGPQYGPGTRYWIGRGYNGYWYGFIDEVKVYERALTTDEIKEHYRILHRKLSRTQR